VSPNIFTASDIGVNTVILLATDDSGNSSFSPALVTIIDTISPTVNTQDITVILDNNGEVIITASQIDNGSLDNTGIANMSVSQANFTCSDLGANLVTLTATDLYGNSQINTATVTVIDTIAPVISSTATILTSTNTNCSLTGLLLTPPIVSDNCSAVTLSNNAPSIFPIGNTIVTWTAADGSGNLSTSNQLVTVQDNEAPTLLPPSSILVSTNNDCFALNVDIGQAIASDNCGIASVSNDAPSTFPIGLTTVNWIAEDNAGNITTATQTITVEDDIDPVIYAPDNITANADINCEAFINNLGIPIVTDNCTILTITNDAPVTFPLGVTTVTWTAIDESSNTASATQIVNVIDIISPVASLNNVTVTLPVDGSAEVDASDIDAGSYDNCGSAFISLSQDTFTCEDLGDNTIVVTITDESGNSIDTTITVTVEPSGIDADFDNIDDACDNNIIDYIDVPNGFTPDGDGINDTFVIPGLQNYKTVAIHIYNRYGNLVFQSDNYQNDWNGVSSVNGQTLPDGTYYYVLELDDIESKGGYVYINRVY
jgi:gliding motility-associated-like protein